MPEQNQQQEIADILKAMDRGDDGALDQLMTAIYPELKRLAHFQLSHERSGHTLNTTAVVHEAFLRLASSDGSWSDRSHFLRAAARVMRHLLVDHARRKNAEKRGGGEAPVTLKESSMAGDEGSAAVLAMDRALKDIAQLDPRLERIIECRYFAGMSVAETAEALDMAVRTVERDSQRARAYMKSALEINEPD
ncbi:MAG: ECF-type sigma factor [Xanthomonadales bacterium]|nr:ECF-type sigma factor [Xanthomonadales bacterium]